MNTADVEQQPAESALTRRLSAVGLMLLGLALFLPPEVFMSPQRIGDFRFFDNSWRYVLPYDFADGQWQGRDVINNQGLLFQIVHSVGYLLPPYDVASMIRFWGLAEALVMLPMLWLALRTSGGSLGWRQMSFLVWMLIAAAPTEFHASHIKPMGGLLPVLWGAWLLGDDPSRQSDASLDGRRMRTGIACAAWLLAPPLLCLYSFEIGVMCALAELATAGVLFLIALPIRAAAGDQRISSPDAAEAHARLRGLRLQALAGGVAAALGLGLYFAPALVSARWAGYLGELISLTSSYGHYWAAGGSNALLLTLALPLPALLIVVVLAWVGLRRAIGQGQPLDGPTLALIAGACYAACFIRYGITRSDVFHLWRALAPAVFVYGCFLPSYLNPEVSRRSLPLVEGLRQRWPGVAKFAGGERVWLARGLMAVCLVPFMFAATFNAGWKIRLSAWLQTSLAPATVVITDPTIEAMVETAKAQDQAALLMWPYGALVNVLSGKRNVSYTGQAIEAHNPLLQAAAISRLEDNPEAPVIVYTAARQNDGVAVVSRTPEILQYLLDRYELREPVQSSFAILQPRADATPRWQRIAVPLVGGVYDPTINQAPPMVPADALSFQPGGERRLILSLAGSGCRKNDLLLVRMRTTPTRTYGIGKSGHFFFGLQFDSGETLGHRIPLGSDGTVHELLISGIDVDDPQFMALFDPAALDPDTPGDDSPALESLQMTWSPLDVLSCRPAEITCLGIERLVRVDAPPSSAHGQPAAQADSAPAP